MSQENSPEVLFDIDRILLQFTKALMTASDDLHKTFQDDKNDLPYAYHIPKMVNVQGV